MSEGFTVLFAMIIGGIAVNIYYNKVDGDKAANGYEVLFHFIVSALLLLGSIWIAVTITS